jgi:uncharacterized protein YbjT (DUF2867 family)
MQLLIVGSTGGTGRELAAKALAKGFEVAAFACEPTKLKDIREAASTAWHSATSRESVPDR